jgi:GNAT superfamily N-acetyltransferase
LEAYLAPLYPQESHHGLNVERLLAEAVAFFVLRYNGAAASCAGIKLVGSAYGEVKRMYVRPQFRGFGFGKLLLNHLATHAQNYGVGCLRLETGIFQTEAIALYERMGFRQIPPFGDYQEDPLGLFYEKLIG